jgi:hypothetical protein
MPHKLIPWYGGKTPEGITEDTVIEVIFRNGSRNIEAGWANGIYWENLPEVPHLDIVYYRIISEK